MVIRVNIPPSDYCLPCNFSAACGDPSMRGKLLFSAGKTPLLTARLAQGEDPLRLARAVVRVYTNCLPAQPETP